MSMIVVTPSLAYANAGALCHHRPSLQQLKGAPQQLSTCAVALRSTSLLGLRRGCVRGSELARRNLQGGPRADSETEERPIGAEGNGRVGGLNELDNQLRSLSSSDNSASVAKQTSKGNVEKLPGEEEKRVDWPVFGDGFVLYVSIGLILLTIITNILFKLFLGSPVPRSPRLQGTEVPQQTPSDGSQRERYRVRSYKDPKYFRNIAPPPVTDGPLS